MPLHLFMVNGLDIVFCFSWLRVFWAFEHTEVALSYYSSRACNSVPKQATIKNSTPVLNGFDVRIRKISTNAP